MMGQLQLAAMVAPDHAGNGQLVMGAAFVLAGLGRFPERYRHVPTSLSDEGRSMIFLLAAVEQLAKRLETRIDPFPSAAALALVQVLPAFGTKPPARLVAQRSQRKMKEQFAL